jgi:hypothetical protein
LAVFIMVLGSSSPASPASSFPALLSPGTFPLTVIRVNQRGGSSVAVTTTGGSIVETFNILPESLQLTLVPPTLTALDLRGVLLRRLVFDGIEFNATPPVGWRPLNILGLLVPLVPWTWKLQSNIGGITLANSSVAQLPLPKIVRGVPTLVQRVDTTLTFGGNASGVVTIHHWEPVGDSSRFFEIYSGTVTAFGTTKTVDSMIMLGDLKTLAG